MTESLTRAIEEKLHVLVSNTENAAYLVSEESHNQDEHDFARSELYQQVANMLEEAHALGIQEGERQAFLVNSPSEKVLERARQEGIQEGMDRAVAHIRMNIVSIDKEDIENQYLTVDLEELDTLLESARTAHKQKDV